MAEYRFEIHENIHITSPRKLKLVPLANLFLIFENEREYTLNNKHYSD